MFTFCLLALIASSSISPQLHDRDQAHVMTVRGIARDFLKQCQHCNRVQVRRPFSSIPHATLLLLGHLQPCPNRNPPISTMPHEEPLLAWPFVRFQRADKHRYGERRKQYRLTRTRHLRSFGTVMAMRRVLCSQSRTCVCEHTPHNVYTAKDRRGRRHVQ